MPTHLYGIFTYLENILDKNMNGNQSHSAQPSLLCLIKLHL